MSNIFPSSESGYPTLTTNQLNSASADYDYDLLTSTNGNGFRHSSMMNAYNWQRSNTQQQSAVPGTSYSSNQNIPQLNQTQVIHIISSATHWDLMAAKNETYCKLYDDHMKEKWQGEAQRERVIELKEELKEARQGSKAVLVASSNIPPYKATTSPFTDQTAEISVPPAPPIADENDHNAVRFWRKSEWRNFEESEKKRNRNTVKFSFICDESGESIVSSRIDEIGDAAKLAWNELHHFRLAPTTWAKKIDRANEYFSNTMRTKFPELRLCQGDWKLQEFATERYPAWCRYFRDGKSAGLSARPSIQVPSRKRKADHGDSSTIPKEKKRKTPINKTPPPEVTVIQVDDDNDIYVDEDTVPVDPPDRHDVEAHPTSLSASESNTPPTLSTSLSPLSASPALSAPTLSSSSSVPRPPLSSDSASSPLTPENGNPIQTSSPRFGSISDTTVTTPLSAQISIPEVPPSSLVTTTSTSNPIQNGGHPSPYNQPTVISSLPESDNPFANLDIPRPPTEVTSSTSSLVTTITGTGPSSEAHVKKTKKGKPMVASPTLLTSRNLFATDYLKANPSTTAAEFKTVYDHLDPDSKKKYEDMSKERKAAACGKDRN